MTKPHAPKPLRLRVGRHYRRRDGVIVRLESTIAKGVFHTRIGGEIEHETRTYRQEDHGAYTALGNRPWLDLIREVTIAPAAARKTGRRHGR